MAIAFEPLFEAFHALTDWLESLASTFSLFIDSTIASSKEMEAAEAARRFAAQEGAAIEKGGLPEAVPILHAISTLSERGVPKAGAGETPTARGGTTVNVQNMTIKQEFRGKADPDRVVAAFTKAITRQAESKISAGGIPVFSR